MLTSISQTIFPNSEKAIPKTNAERAMDEQNIGQAPSGGGALEDPDDQPFGEMAKDARVWRTYVRETDRWDKELVDGRNSSLDVLLIFAALFSAISTTFIIASLDDLRPDHAETSAKALLAISRKLDLIASGQAATLLPTHNSELDAFSPSRASIVVNVLWLLSLSLSVGVSLIAMLAKDWCYRFMSGRTGHVYEQGRKRQQRWHGIKKWRMQEALAHLPGLMHLALFLFAVGLCVYLWNLNVSAAVPVMVVTLLATSAYAAATVIPLIDGYCPYGTPVTPMLTPWLVSTMAALHTPGRNATRFLYSSINRPVWLRHAFRCLSNWFAPTADLQLDPGEPDRPMKSQLIVPMDFVTGQMLAWMIANCEDSRSVDVALLAIAGTRSKLPLSDSAKTEVIYTAYTRLIACVERNTVSDKYCPRSADMLYVALRYCQAYHILIPKEWSGQPEFISKWLSRTQHVGHIHHNLVAYSQNRSVDTSSHVEKVTRTIQMNLWPRVIEARKSEVADAAQRATAFLRSYVSDHGVHISELSLANLLESCGYYMVIQWPKEPDSKLPLVLVQLFLAVQETAPEVAQSIAIILATAALACDTYPSGHQPPAGASSQAERALQVLEHYQMSGARKDGVNKLLTFGVTALLPHLRLGAADTQALDILSSLFPILRDAVCNSGGPGIYTVPSSYTWAIHFQQSYHGFSPDLINASVVDRDLNIAWFDALLLRAQLRDHALFVPALVLLCQAESEEVQHMCISSIRSLSVAGTHAQLSAILQSWYQLPETAKYISLVGDKVMYPVIFYLQLLVATVMLSSSYSLSERQYNLRSMIWSYDRSRRVTPSSQDPSLPAEEDVLNSLARHKGQEDVQDAMLCTLQLAVDFCHVDPGRHGATTAEPGVTTGWVAKLQQIKDDYEHTHLDKSGPSGSREGSANLVAGMWDMLLR